MRRPRKGLLLFGLSAILVLGTGAPPAAAQTGGESSVGYIDSAIPDNQVRFRFDAAFHANRPDRAEFIYARPGGLGGPGLPLPEPSVDFQEISAYVETLLAPELSGFLDLPARFLAPEVNNDSAGITDMDLGFKWAFLCEKDQVLSLQTRLFVPTGDPHRGLGNNHFTLEPALLAYDRLTERLTLEAELRDWIPLGGTDFAGNVVRYGAGLSYRVVDTCTCRVAPVVELVGWSVLSGNVAVLTSPTTSVAESASGDTIVNAKFGVRFGPGGTAGDAGEGNVPWDVYIGYGRALTGDVWYRDIVRVEFRLHY